MTRARYGLITGSILLLLIVTSCGRSQMTSSGGIDIPEGEQFTANEADSTKPLLNNIETDNEIDDEGDNDSNNDSDKYRNAAPSTFRVRRMCSNRQTQKIGTNLVSSNQGVVLKLYDQDGDEYLTIKDRPDIRDQIINEARFSLNLGTYEVEDGTYTIAICDARFASSCHPGGKTGDGIGRGTIGVIRGVPVEDGESLDPGNSQVIANANIKDTLMRQNFMSAFTGMLSGQAPNPNSFFQTFANINSINMMDSPEECDAEASPLVIDFGEDGIPLSAPTQGIEFDITAAGVPSKISWTTQQDDGFLVWDRNGDGQINDATELFGNSTPEVADNPQSNGFLALKAFDSNDDDAISHLDPIFQKLQIWFDRNDDGLTQSNELVSASAAGLASIDLNYLESSHQDLYGNRFAQTSTVKLVNGEEKSIYDIWFRLP